MLLMPPEKESQELAIKAEMEESPPEDDTKLEETVPPQQAGEILVSLSPHSSDCSDLKEELDDTPQEGLLLAGPATPHDTGGGISTFLGVISDESEHEEDAKMPPKKESEARSPASVSMPLDTVGQDEPEPETARGSGSASARLTSLKRPFEESFATLPAKGALSKRYGQKGSDTLPPWKAAEEVLIKQRWRSRRVERAPATRSRSSPPTLSEKEKRHWQNIREMEIPSENQVQNIRYCDHALGNHVLHRLELPKEEVYDTLRGEMELAVDDEGHATDQQLLDFQKHVEQSIREPLHDPALKKGTLGRHV